MTAPLELVGNHPSVAALRDLVARVARSQARTVLLYGETGTGKSLVARLLHQQSSRADAEFIDINCAAIPGQLLESELFGHERGAFTGAVGKKEGLIEAGNGGTVFLDEVRELDLVMQSKLLTLLDTRRFRRVGAIRPISVDVRFIAATNKILLSEVNAGKFREDLYYRLQVISINIPPLRERGDDILLLAHHALQRYNRQYGSRMERIDPEVERIFRAYRWPGNVRELENLLERICLLETGHCVLPAHLPARILREMKLAAAAPADQMPMPAAPAGPLDYHAATAQFQAGLIGQALSACGGNLAEAARRLGLSRHALRHQMSKLGLPAS
ncbi:Sigma54 specific transcriptional regulator Fis family [Cupriavidus taiwanensis]|uniref:sigma-54 interaction domain-containing protein n=1 Tax=Cupriavidus taiwanensis TaxID=164546 RepID=UPI000E1ACC0F|nr:sigma-54 dependent transcriptional regulator [Cupriavidus taiwanensis]SOZ18399.1 Sigma54 specific transcriptional regulator Fis family [Cupriavidus taiwanensis]SOZ31472.1 Sigma54 specific transcriptional regulator Fis family [Cupriavidus taiwanensis]SOZ47434.1 Sigma54 specific transcriptional regulator Fis family [Cupriavidus taiwanensis]